MSYDKLIHEYLDEGLTDTDQEALFAEISRNPEIRQEFNNQLRMQIITREDMNSIVPPIDATNVVFTRLGFAPPASTGAIVTGGGIAGLIKSKTFISTVSSIVAILLTSFYFMNFYEKDGSNVLASNLGHNKTTNLTPDSKGQDQGSFLANMDGNVDSEGSISSNNDLINSKPVTNSNSNSSSRNSFLNTSRNTISSAYDLSSNNNSTDYDESNSDASSSLLKNTFGKLADQVRSGLSNLSLGNDEDQSIEDPTNNVDVNTPLSSDVSLNTNGIYNSNPSINNTRNNELETFNIDSTRFAIQWRYISSSSNINVNLPGSNNPMLNNSISFIWKVHSKHLVGLEVGLEEVDQEYSERVAGNLIVTRQRPETFWYGLSYRYRESDLSFINNKLIPYIYAFGGSSNFGPVVRGQLGFELQPLANSPLVLITAYELSNFTNYSGGGTYNTMKRGFTLGLNYNF